MRRWMCSPVRVGIECRQYCTHIILLKKAWFYNTCSNSRPCASLHIWYRRSNDRPTRPSNRSSSSNSLLLLPPKKKSRGHVLLRQSEGWRHKSLYHLRTLIDGQLVPLRGARTLIHAHNSGTTCLRVYVPSQKLTLSAWPIIPIILSVRSCYILYILQLRACQLVEQTVQINSSDDAGHSSQRNISRKRK